MSPKPWFREFDDCWYVQIRVRGKRRQVKLVKGRDNEAEAFRRWHDLMSRSASTPSAAPAVASQTVHAMVDLFLEHVSKNSAAATYTFYLNFLSSFCRTIDRSLTVTQVKPYHVTRWLDDKKKWSVSTKGNGIRSVRRAFRWSAQEGYIDFSPMAMLKGMRCQPRETIISPEQFEVILQKVTDEPFRDFLRFLWHTGARPQEVREVTAKHVELHLRRIVFPTSQAKGKRAPRVIYLDDVAFEIVAARCQRFPKGPLFRNRLHKPWGRNAIRCRFRRLKDRIGERYCAYHFRHSFATNALQHLDPITVSVLMGHADASTLARTYQHLAKKPEYLQAAAKKAAIRATDSSTS